MTKETDLPPANLLTLAEALVSRKGATAKDKDDAEKILESIKDKVPPEDASRVAALIDPKLPEKLGLPKPASEGAPAKPAAPAKSPKKKGR